MTEYTNLFSPYDFKRNDDTILNYFMKIHKYKMESYCLKYRKYIKSINPQVSSTSNDKLMILSKCAIYGSKNSKFINKQEASGLFSKLGIKTPLSKVPILGGILF